jgi:Family of unknown function (DUF5317)
MIVVVCTLIGMATALFSKERFLRLGAISFRHVELVWIALIGQVLLFEWLARHIPMWATEVLHYVSYALIGVFVYANRRIPGASIIAIGGLCNLVAIAANGGSMPADMDAWATAGLDPIPQGVFENSAALSDPRLGFLGDIFAIPESWPLSNVFSIGDVLIVLGGTWFAHRWCSRPHAASAPEAAPADGFAAAGA